jgi:hypothetical protein
MNDYYENISKIFDLRQNIDESLRFIHFVATIQHYQLKRGHE